MYSQAAIVHTNIMGSLILVAKEATNQIFKTFWDSKKFKSDQVKIVEKYFDKDIRPKVNGLV